MQYLFFITYELNNPCDIDWEKMLALYCCENYRLYPCTELAPVGIWQKAIALGPASCTRDKDWYLCSFLRDTVQKRKHSFESCLIAYVFTLQSSRRIERESTQGVIQYSMQYPIYIYITMIICILITILFPHITEMMSKCLQIS